MPDPHGNARRDAEAPSAVSDSFSGYSIGGIPLGVPVSLGAIPPRVRGTPPWELSVAPAPVTLTQAQPSASGLLFGAFQRGSIRGVKFNDLDANATRDPGEPGLTGWRIFLDQ